MCQTIRKCTSCKDTKCFGNDFMLYARFMHALITMVMKGIFTVVFHVRTFSYIVREVLVCQIYVSGVVLSYFLLRKEALEISEV